MATSRIVWLILTLMVLAGFAYHISVQFSKYLSYPVRLSITEVKDYAPFPDITVCPATFFSKRRDSISQVFPNEDKKYIETYMQKNLAFLWNAILFNSTSNLPFEKRYEYVQKAKHTILSQFAASQVAPTFADTLIDCEYSVDRCNLSHITSFFHPYYGLCYTFSPSNDKIVSSSISSGLKMLMSFTDKLYVDVKLASQTVIPGSTVFLHRRKSYPDMEYPFRFISSGRMLLVDYTYSNIYRLFTPKEPCEEENEYELCRVEPFNRRKCRNYTETPYTRQSVNRQIELHKQCGCISEEWPIPVSLKNVDNCHYFPKLAFTHKGFEVHSNGTVFLQHPEDSHKIPLDNIVDLHKVRTRYHCYKRVRDELMKRTDEKRLCLFANYETKTNYGYHLMSDASGIMIPYVSIQNRFGQYVIDSIESTKPQLSELNVSSIFFQKVNDSNKIVDYLRIWLHSPRYISRAFAGYGTMLYVYSSTAKSYTKLETNLYDALFFLADTGGILGLWVGFSLLSIVDIIQVAIVRYRRKKDAKIKVESE